MNEEQYRILSENLKKAATRIPLHWGRIQNNGYDNELKRHCNIYGGRNEMCRVGESA